MILQEEMGAVSDHIYITSDDGSIGQEGFVTNVLARLLADGVQIDLIIAIGPLPMMESVAETSRAYGVKTIAGSF